MATDEEKNMTMRMLDAQAQYIVEQLERIDASAMEIDYLKHSLDELKSTPKDSEILAPVSSGIFVKTKLQQSDVLLVNVGNDVVVEKTVDQTKALLDERTHEMVHTREALLAKLQEIEDQATKLGEQ